MKKKVLAAMLVAAMTATMFAGCGSKDNGRRCIHSCLVPELQQILHLYDRDVCNTCICTPDQCIRDFFLTADVEIFIQISQFIFCLVPEISYNRIIVMRSRVYHCVASRIIMWQMFIGRISVKCKHQNFCVQPPCLCKEFFHSLYQCLAAVSSAITFVPFKTEFKASVSLRPGPFIHRPPEASVASFGTI